MPDRIRSVAGILLFALADAAAAQSPAPPATFSSDRIIVTTRGSGPDIILIPGLASHPDVWAPTAKRLQDRYRLHFVHVHGFAGAAPGANAEGPVSAPVAEEIARYIRQTGLKAPALIGHSMGGAIALMAGARHADLVGRVMVVDMPAALGGMFGPPDTWQKTADDLRARILSDTPGSPTGMLEQMFQGMTNDDSVRAMLAKWLQESHRPTLANSFHELVLADLRPELPKIARLTLLYVVPANSPVPPDQYEAGMRESYANARNARLIKIDASNHYIQVDQLERFVEEVAAFMKR
jgi:pimeloyl-ACP methyl ester carboxylesterase